jgi:hypothetical protein
VAYDFVILLIYPLMLAGVAFGLYWVIRLGVRAGIKDADARRAAERQVPPPS